MCSKSFLFGSSFVPFVLFCGQPLFAAEIDQTKLAEIGTAAEAAITRGDCPGAVVVVVHDDTVAQALRISNTARCAMVRRFWTSCEYRCSPSAMRSTRRVSAPIS